MSWIDSEIEKAEKERIERLKRATGGLELYRISEGIHEIVFYPNEVPSELNTRFGVRKLIPCEVSGKNYALLINPSSPLWRQLLMVFRANKGRKMIKVRISRVGTGRTTQYALSIVE